MLFHIGSGSGQIALIENEISIQKLNPVLIVCHLTEPLFYQIPLVLKPSKLFKRD
jgi:hypothetical protein